MFYVTDINGNLQLFISKALQPELAPAAGASAKTVTELNSAAEPSSVASAKIDGEKAASALTQSLSSETVLEQDAAVFDGHVPNTSTLEVLDHIGVGAGAAASAMAYRAISQLGTGSSSEEESPEKELEESRPLHSTYATESHDGKHQEVLHPNRVMPISDYGHQRNISQKRPALVASQIMSSPVFSLQETATLFDAVKFFHEKRFRHIPIISAQGKLIGIVSDRDLIPQYSVVGASAAVEKPRFVKEIMKTNILTARPETEIRAMAKVMFEQRVGSMPIVNEAGALCGIITRSDILRTVVNRSALELWT